MARCVPAVLVFVLPLVVAVAAQKLRRAVVLVMVLLLEEGARKRRRVVAWSKMVEDMCECVCAAVEQMCCGRGSVSMLAASTKAWLLRACWPLAIRS